MLLILLVQQVVYYIEVTWSDLLCFRYKILKTKHWLCHTNAWIFKCYQITGSYTGFPRSAAVPGALLVLCWLALMVYTEAWEEGRFLWSVYLDEGGLGSVQSKRVCCIVTDKFITTILITGWYHLPQILKSALGKLSLVHFRLWNVLFFLIITVKRSCESSCWWTVVFFSIS